MKKRSVSNPFAVSYAYSCSSWPAPRRFRTRQIIGTNWLRHGYASQWAPTQSYLILYRRSPLIIQNDSPRWKSSPIPLAASRFWPKHAAGAIVQRSFAPMKSEPNILVIRHVFSSSLAQHRFSQMLQLALTTFDHQIRQSRCCRRFHAGFYCCRLLLLYRRSCLM